MAGGQAQRGACLLQDKVHIKALHDLAYAHLLCPNLILRAPSCPAVATVPSVVCAVPVHTFSSSPPCEWTSSSISFLLLVKPESHLKAQFTRLVLHDVFS